MLKTQAAPRENCLARLRGMLPSLHSAEKKVAEYALGNAQGVLDQSVSEVAIGAGASEATVIRFCRTMGYRGFQDLKINLARDLVSPIHHAIHEDVSERDGTATIIRKVFSANIETLQSTLEALKPEAVGEAVKLLSKAKKILIIGVGTSTPILFDAFNKFLRLGLWCSYQNDSHLQMMEAALLRKGDLVLAISHSGSTRDPIDTIEVARKNGVKAIAITNNSLSPLAKVADVVLVTSSKETKYRSEALASRIAQSSIIDVLYITIGMTNRQRTLANTRKIEDAIVAKQY
ncbi:MAG: MurR/RpiR family transcriptional regulator [Nitrospinae bacterium]|nr:MurR/RpiR family transcriptional regulator [Nitrospinota bacterium]